MAELVDARDSKSRGATHEGSIPSPGTKTGKLILESGSWNVINNRLLNFKSYLLLPYFHSALFAKKRECFPKKDLRFFFKFAKIKLFSYLDCLSCLQFR